MPTLEQRLDIFRDNGPYTFARAMQLAKMCARGDDLQIGDTLSECVHKFPPRELERLLNAEKYCTAEEYKAWLRGSENWSLKNYEGEFDEGQLAVIAMTPMDDYADNIDFAEMSYKHKLAILKIHNEHLREFRKRDRSPERR